MPASKSTRRVLAALHDLGIDSEVTEMPGSTRTAVDAANAVGCEVAQIVKSLVFASDDGRAWLVLTSGTNRVDPDRLADCIGTSATMADPATVREATGFAIGGVAPVGLARDLPVVMDAELLSHDVVWAAAGTPKSVFPVAPDVLRSATNAAVAPLASDA